MKAAIYVLAGLLSITACAPVTPRLEALELPPKRSVHIGFSLMPPNETGWLVAPYRPQLLVLGKRAGHPDENTVLRAFTVVLPEFSSRDEFMGFAKTAIGEYDPLRFSLLSQEAAPATVKGQPCATVKRIEEDRGAVKVTNRTDAMLIEAHALVCPHPNKKVAVVVAYSHRYYPGHADPASAQKAASVYETLEFRDF